MCIWNTREKEVLIPKGTIIGSWSNIRPSQVFSLRRRPEAAKLDRWLKEGAKIDPPSVDDDAEEVESWVAELWNENMSNKLSSQQKERMLKVLRRRRQAFPTRKTK